MNKQSGQNSSQILLAVYGGLIAFCTYSCMYAFRKGFAVGAYDYQIFGMQAKVVFVVGQLIGYTLSKFYGIRFISGLHQGNRMWLIIGLNVAAWLALLMFALSAGPVQAVAIFISGIPLGLIWGLVFSFLEGRKTTELMGAFLCVSFIFSSGFVKSVAKWLQVDFNIPEAWVPFATGGVFLLPLILFTWLLSRMPPPDAVDIQSRSERLPMTAVQRKSFIKRFFPGLSLLVIVYVMLSILRDIRDNFMADVWREHGVDHLPALFTKTEIPSSVIILLIVGLMFLIRNNKVAFSVSLLLVFTGLIISTTATLLFQAEKMDVVTWVTFTGLGLYLGYIPFNIMVYERLIAVLKEPVNIGFLVYISDALGYLGSMGVLVVNEFTGVQATNWTLFLTKVLLWAGVAGGLFTLASWIYFSKKNTSYA
jgi:hypothetical protein